MHVHIGGIQAVVDFLQILVMFGALNLLMMRFKDRSAFAASYCNLFGLT